MVRLATTKLSSKGQVVIPEAIRNRLGLEAGVQFVVVAEGDVVVLKVLKAPNMSDFKALLDKAQKSAEAAGLTPKPADSRLSEPLGPAASLRITFSASEPAPPLRFQVLLSSFDQLPSPPPPAILDRLLHLCSAGWVEGRVCGRSRRPFCQKKSVPICSEQTSSTD